MTDKKRPSFGPFSGKLFALPPFKGENRMINTLAKLCGLGIRQTYLWPNAKFTVDLHDRVQRQMWLARYEPHLALALLCVLRTGSTFLDVGAHIGYFSTFAAGLVGSSGRVFSFEADPLLYERLQENLLPFPWALPGHSAVWDEAGTLSFARSPDPAESGWGRIAAFDAPAESSRVSIPCVSLDSVFEKSSLSTVGAIKIDAEGSEARILAGAHRMISACRPVLFLEVNGPVLTAARTSPKDLGEVLHSLGYQIFELSYGRLRRLSTLDNIQFCDCLCLPNENKDPFISAFLARNFSLC